MLNGSVCFELVNLKKMGFWVSLFHRRDVSREDLSIWIQFILLKIENLKYCSKIIFKCVKNYLWGQWSKLVYSALGPIWWCGYVRGEVNDWKGPRLEDHVREEWRGKVRGGYPSRIERTSVRKVTRRLRWPSRNF